MEEPKVLVACPVHVIKKYAVRKWIDNVKSFTYPNYDIYVVDNSPSDAFHKNYLQEVDSIHINTDQQLPILRINRSMEVIRRKADTYSYDFWFNLEIDVIPQVSNIIQEMVKISTEFELDILNHAYPSRWNPRLEHQGVGFTLFSRNFFTKISFLQAGDGFPDAFIWKKVRKTSDFRMFDIWNVFPVLHLTT
jgi:hypothetical protein